MHYRRFAMEREHAYLAFDVGGTKLAAGVVTVEGRVLVRDRVPTPSREPWRASAALLRRVLAAVHGVDVVACGVACGGPMSPGGEQVSPLHIPAWRGFELKRNIVELTGLPTFVDNDAKALVLAERWLGAARGAANCMAVVVGTGVGGGIVLDGRLLGGRLGNAGHIGHVVVEPDGLPCACGGRGCLEAYICGPAVRAETGRPPSRAPLAIMERNGRLLGRAVASVVALLDLPLTVVGGSVALGFGAPFFDAAQQELSERARLAFAAGSLIRPVGLGADGSLVGAAALVHEAVG